MRGCLRCLARALWRRGLSQHLRVPGVRGERRLSRRWRRRTLPELPRVRLERHLRRPRRL